MQLQIETGLEDPIVLALMLYSDSTRLSSTGKQTSWPIMMSLGNIPLEHRSCRGGFKLLGVIPDTKGLKAIEKAKVFKECLDRLLAPLKTLSHDGFELSGRFFYPLLYAYVHDYPEGCKVLFINYVQLI